MTSSTSCPNNRAAHGFTLIELSIVLVIIGLIVGGVLVGRDLISAAQVRAQISQIEKYNTAVNTFQAKYNALPGDMLASDAASFGFTPRGGGVGDGDGNGVIEGGCYGELDAIGETSMFWGDLGVAQLIDGSFPNNTDARISSIEYGGTLPGTAYLPQAKIGGGNNIYVWSGGAVSINGGTTDLTDCTGGGIPESDGINYFGLSAGIGINWGSTVGGPGLTVSQAYAIDSKMDDGLPQSGHVTTMYVGNNGSVNVVWANGGPGVGAPPHPAFGPAPGDTSPNPGSSTTCYDNNSGTQQYSMEINGGANINCALSFQFQ